MNGKLKANNKPRQAIGACPEFPDHNLNLEQAANHDDQANFEYFWGDPQCDCGVLSHHKSLRFARLFDVPALYKVECTLRSLVKAPFTAVALRPNGIMRRQGRVPENSERNDTSPKSERHQTDQPLLSSSNIDGEKPAQRSPFALFNPFCRSTRTYGLDLGKTAVYNARFYICATLQPLRASEEN